MRPDPGGDAVRLRGRPWKGRFTPRFIVQERPVSRSSLWLLSHPGKKKKVCYIFLFEELKKAECVRVCVRACV